MTRFTPATLARPLLGGPRGARLANAGPRRGAVGGVLAMCLLAATTLIGVLVQAPCIARGWDLPYASFRMCASPLANGLTGATFPDAAGRAPGAIAEFSPLTAWVIELGRWSGAAGSAGDVAFFMVLVLLANVLAVAAGGIALIALARTRAERMWVPVAFVSPVIAFSLGQSLDPIAVALALWACVLLRPLPAERPPGAAVVGTAGDSAGDSAGEGAAGTAGATAGDRGQEGAAGSAARPVAPRSPIAAGVLLALATFINPLGLILLLALTLVHVSRRRLDELAVAGGVFVLVSGIFIVVDGRLFGRLAAWWAEAVDRGSIVSLLSFEPSLDRTVLALVSVIAWAAALVIASAVMLAGRHRTPLSLPAVATMLLGLSLLFMPAAPTWNALWLLPFAALAVRHLWIHVAWGLSEAALAIAIHLSDVTPLESSEGLSPMWLSIFTLLRLFALAFLVHLAAERLRVPEDAPPEGAPGAGPRPAAPGSAAASGVPPAPRTAATAPVPAAERGPTVTSGADRDDDGRRGDAAATGRGRDTERSQD